jgi:hypothetical protein
VTVRLAHPPIARAQAALFFAAWRARHGAGPAPNDLASWLHERLLDATLLDEPPVIRRALAINTAGVPIVYSHKSMPGARPPRFRMLAEPGGTGITVAEQVSLARELVRNFCERAGWRQALRRAEAVIEVLLPTEPNGFDDWHGGLGFGLEVSEDGPDLRVYCNVRHGSFLTRWQRLADAVGEFADKRAQPAFRELLDRAAPLTSPAGLALAITDDKVHAIRLYCGLVEATADSAIAAAPGRFTAWAPAIRNFVDSHLTSVGGLEEQDITLAFDFAIRDWLLVPRVARYKVDVRCTRATALDAPAVAAWAADTVAALGLDPSPLAEFVSDVERAFGGCAIQYVSLGCFDGGPELAVYCIPGPFEDVVAALRGSDDGRSYLTDVSA